MITTHTLTATYSINTFTLTFRSGANGSGSNQTLTKTYGTALILPNSATANGYFTRTGYTVTGWTTTDGSAQTHALAGSFTTEAITTFYPVWSARTDNGVTYENQGATTAQIGGSTTYTTAAAIATIPTTPPLKTNFAFKGWYTSSTGGTRVTNGSYTPESPFGTVTLYAQWNSTNAALSAITLSGSTVLSPNFATGTFIYTASVANTVATGFTVTATKSESNASVVQYLGATSSTAFTGSLSIGANIIRTIVTAQDGITTKTYTLTVTRAATPPSTSVVSPTTNAVLVLVTTKYLENNPISARINTPARVTFLANNKAIPGCTAIKTVATTQLSDGTNQIATCQYRPTSLGSITFSATITPNSTDYLTVTRSLKVNVSPR